MIAILELKSNIEETFERVKYINCVVLAMSNNINIIDDTKRVFIVDKPSIDATRSLASVNLKIPSMKFSVLLFILGARSE